MLVEPTTEEVSLEPEYANQDAEEGVVRRAQGGDQRAFEQLYRRHVGRVYALCLRICADSTHAEELTQDAFVRVWEMIGSFRGESAFSSWLHRVTVNVVLLDLRSTRRREARVFPAEDLSEFDASEGEPPPGTTMDLEQAIASLPPKARSIFVLHDVEGYRHGEIAKRMGLAVGTCKAQLHRARKLLKEVLRK